MSVVGKEKIMGANMKMRDSDGKPKMRHMTVQVIDCYMPATANAKCRYRFGGVDAKTGDNMSVLTKEETAKAASKSLGIKITNKKMKPRKKKEDTEKPKKKAPVKKATKKVSKKQVDSESEVTSSEESVETKPKKKAVKKPAKKAPVKRKTTSKSKKESSSSESDDDSDSYGSESSD